jgi:hypothetical protein
MMPLIANIVSAVIPLRTYVSYLDPGSGSFILQILIATLVGGLFVVRMYWKRITGFFRNLFNKGRSDSEE